VIKKTGVVGAGTMGQGIATAFSMYGYEVHLFDLDKAKLTTVKEDIRNDLQLLVEESLIEGSRIPQVLNNILLFDNLKESVEDCDYVIEAVPEYLILKQELLRQLDNFCPAKTILATNTSSLRLQDLMIHLSDSRKERTMVNHWYNPAYLIPIIELSSFGNTCSEVFEVVSDFYKSIGKQPVKVLKDVPGLVANRIQQAIAREVFSLIEMEVASAVDIDNALKFGPAFRYATTGQLEIADFGGLDIWSITGDNLLPVMDNAQEANKLLKNKVSEGKLGFKSGEGFFEYDMRKKASIKKEYFRKLIRQLKVSNTYR